MNNDTPHCVWVKYQCNSHLQTFTFLALQFNMWGQLAVVFLGFSGILQTNAWNWRISASYKVRSK